MVELLRKSFDLVLVGDDSGEEATSNRGELTLLYRGTVTDSSATWSRF